ncbi:MAG: urea amidolyase family protein [Micropruina sp.]|uniref:5-oxoprolinase subunit B/C family protein n=1 Tax=Micropruina sp. TaxID=2737536 RepID=UPI0039E520D5
MDGRLLPCGERAVLVELDGLDAVLGLQRALQPLLGSGPFAAVVDLVPAATTLLLGLADGAAPGPVRDALAGLLTRLDGTPSGPADAETVTIDVVYDGADLDEVARLTGLPASEVVAAHTGTDWTVAFGGFAPGFSYLTGGDPRLEVPRRAEPRTTVPAGAVGLAGPFSGIYPRPSPGGWQLIGRTDAALWDAERDPPALLRPGARVRFRAIEPPKEPVETTPGPRGRDKPDRPAGPDAGPGLDELDRGAQGLDVLAAGPLALIVDEGRPGYAALGVGRSGAADRAAYRLGGRLTGNPPGLAALEITFGGLRVRARSTCLIALTGADCAATVQGRPVTHNGPVYLRAGQELLLGVPRAGLRSYLSVAGGFQVPPVLGSASTDTLSGIGPPRLAAGDFVGVRTPQAPRLLAVESIPRGPGGSGPTLDVLPGPRSDWLADPAALTVQQWRVSDRSDRIGVRLLGDPLPRHPSRAGAELPSEPMVRGSIQVPPDGRPVIFGADHPVTGGYPVVGVLTEAGCDALAQARPGDRVSFRRVHGG